jgi:hypothetical protein
MGERAPHREDEVTVKQKLSLDMGPIECPAPRQTGLQTVGRNVIWNLTYVIAL